MKISLAKKIDRNRPLALFVFEKEAAPEGLPNRKDLLAEAARDGFRARAGSAAVLHPRNGSPSRDLILAGLGPKAKFDAETLRRAAALAAKQAASRSWTDLTYVPPRTVSDAGREIRALAEGALLAGYRFLKYKSKKEGPRLARLEVLPGKVAEGIARQAVKTAQVLVETVSFVRDLVNEPPSRLTPARFAELAREVAREGADSGISVQVLDRKKLEELGMEALLGVNRGSAEPPALVHLRYRPARPSGSLALVGKGITFDSGGLSLKPAESMETMKMDMAGAASVLGVFRALPALKPDLEIHGILALTENMPGGRAQKPGDVLRSLNGKTIEVLNTDAEGRLVLADALAYAVRQDPDAVIDLATLTGACIIALGSLVGGAMTNRDAFYDELEKACAETGERFCRLPLVDDYREGLKSAVADVKNISSFRKEAGTIVGGLFLSEFVDDRPWLHLDIAGTAWTDRELPYCPPGGTGFPVRTLLQAVLNLSAGNLKDL